MEKLKELAGMAIITVLFTLFTIALVSAYIEEYNLLKAEPVTVKTIEKAGAKGLYGPPSYYVRVELPNGEEAPYLNRISNQQIKDFQVGDEVSGYSLRPSDFSTLRDFIFDSIFYLAGILILGLLAFCCWVALILTIPWKQSKQKTLSNKQKKRERKRWKKLNRKKKGSGWGIVGGIIAFFLLFLIHPLWNLLMKLLPFGKTQNEALVLDRDSYVTYRKHEDSSYELTLSFQDDAGQSVQVIKDVTRNTYHQYNSGDAVPITFRNANPYDVFIQNTTFWDLFQLATTWQAYLYFSIIALTVFVGRIYWRDYRKKNSKSQDIQKSR
ncbi:hypothetical protein QT711_07595 [Sporosarcina saromensis]|uniref:DUF3592 domain-containing protein n=1 Tax=Sporosarcina saromensis TaxID=359365 RepID=A0ABU4G7V5_9BACL|nr:hypothetical protein [Sporosarcina saromensis]MDW0113046.1 hypothetical protein [Sporosarcina saromensis]